ncbi:hypothetical protein V8C26DRAFT_107408 [Trichoderma gracile]
MSGSENQKSQAPGEPYFPPPPPGPPPVSTQQQQPYPQFPPPPQQPEAQSHQAQESHHQNEKQQQQQQHEQVQPEQTSQQQHFPPPPPGPPPSQQQQSQYQPQSQPPHQASNYAIPAYDPANPVFAPPPSNTLNEPASPSAYHQPPAEGQQQHQHQQQPYQQAPPSPQHQVAGEQQGHHKLGWGERLSALGMKAAAPINSIAHKLGSQSFLPETLDKECDKAATILKAFCKKGVYADPAATSVPTSTDPNAVESTDRVIDPTKEKPKNRVIVTIPPKVIAKAVGLAIFTTLRAGFQVSGATGSGILIARLEDGSWSPPSGIQLHSVGGGFQIGLDIYDCVCVINSKEALAAFTNTRVSLGSDLAVVAGPYGAGAAVGFGASLESKGKQGQQEGSEAQHEHPQQNLQPADNSNKSHRRSLSASATKPVFSYVKSRGFYAGIRIDGTVVAERKEANAAFYGQAVTVDQILKGQVPPQGPPGMWPAGAQTLYAVLKGAEAGALQASSGNSSPGHHQQQTAQGYDNPQASQGQQHTSLPSYAESGPRPIDGDIKYA